MKLQKQIGFEFEIGSPIGLRTVCKKIKDELGIGGLKTVEEFTVETNHKYDGEIITPVWPFRKGMVNLRRIFRWFEKNGILTNDTCGFHVNLSYKRKELNYMMDTTRLVLCFNEEKWLKVCKRRDNDYIQCYIDELILDSRRRVFANEEKWLKVCKRRGNEYIQCYIDELILDSRRRVFANEEKVYNWIDKKIEDLKDKYRTVNIEKLEEDNPYVEYRCLGGLGYHLRSNIMFKAIIDMSNNMDRALPNARGTSFMTRKVRECFFRKDKHKSFVPH